MLWCMSDGARTWYDVLLEHGHVRTVASYDRLPDATQAFGAAVVGAIRAAEEGNDHNRAGVPLAAQRETPKV
jgi:hypothetical protein